jgi:hypothetical protein
LRNIRIDAIIVLKIVHVPGMFELTYYFEPTEDIREPGVFIQSTGLKTIPVSVQTDERRRKCEG